MAATWFSVILLGQLLLLTRGIEFSANHLRGGFETSSHHQWANFVESKWISLWTTEIDDAALNVLALENSTVHPVALGVDASGSEGKSEAKVVTAAPVGYQLLPLATLILGSLYFMWDKLSQMSYGTNSMLELLAAIAVYYASSPGVIFVNKELMSTYHFHFPVTIGCMGVFGTTLFAHAMVYSGKWEVRREVAMQDWLRSVLPIALCAASALMCGNRVYLYLPVSLIQILKSSTLVETLCFGLLAGVEKFRWNICAAVLLIAAASACVQLDGTGVFHTGSYDMHFVTGLLINICANTSEAGRVILMQVSVLQLTFQDALFWCSRATLGVMVVLILLTEAHDMASFSFHTDIYIRLFGSMVGGCLLTVSSWWLTKLVGGLSLKVLADARNYSVVTLAIYLYDEPFSRIRSIGYSVCIAGIFYYENCKAKAATEKAALEAKNITQPDCCDRSLRTIRSCP